MQFLQRKVYLEVKKHIKSPEISLILGPRQAGKTTIMLKLSEELESQGLATAYFNLDVFEDKQYFITQHTLLDRLEKLVGKGPAVVFIDEIHRLENAGLFLKGLYDLKPSYKFVASGSGSLELKANIIEPMTGRKRIFLCLPLSFTEFAANKLKVDFEQVTRVLDTNPYACQRLTAEYFTYGGYPRVTLSETHKEKVATLAEIYKSYLEKDIQLLLKVEKGHAFETLVKILATQVGNLINRSELASTIGVTQKTVEKYLYLLEKTFVIFLLRPFFKDARRELRKSPKAYFADLGFLRLAQGTLPVSKPLLKGSLFENACFLRLKELNLLETPRFWRSHSGAEVDFVVTSPHTGEVIPIEAKVSPLKRQTLGKSLISFLQRYRPRQAYIYTKKTNLNFKRFGIPIRYLPFHFLPPALLKKS
ncbi:hypothetical protein B5M47_00645 [candidate division CPR3 bacterium 4484_211]|uniref:AAA+ ATPase domain-containing protein n=1 Tax=candidate division CPR3 bacterium 4484_211 TaxID=1968527 RepID=A0A1W9NZD0_UNCC3|nr:MAG: hypothetical protein B5M47_00645 [candidate division CPR3 bacterium 4484_211]